VTKCFICEKREAVYFKNQIAYCMKCRPKGEKVDGYPESPIHRYGFSMTASWGGMF
jgi:hypothetical protein